MTQLRIGIAGLGTVGMGLLSLLLAPKHDHSILSQMKERFIVTGVSARNRNRDRGLSLAHMAWFDDPVALAVSEDIDVFVELMGGESGPAYDAVTAALKSGKHVITANKALMAAKGVELAHLAEEHHVTLRFEAAIAGGVPIVSALRIAMSASTPTMIAGILNGTSNYILTCMETDHLDFHTALKSAQDIGYAETDPIMDISGVDAAQKISLLAAIGFGVMPKLDDILVTGIDHIDAQDIAFAASHHFTIRLIAIAALGEAHEEPTINVSVEPLLVARETLFAKTIGPDNHIMVKGEPLGVTHFTGPGAGAGATASAVAGDLIAIAHIASNGITQKLNISPVFGRPVKTITRPKMLTTPKAELGSELKSDLAQFYLRINVAANDELDHDYIQNVLLRYGILATPSPSQSPKTVSAKKLSFMMLTQRVAIGAMQEALQELRSQYAQSGEVVLFKVANF